MISFKAIVLITITFLINKAQTGNILYVAPFPAISHYKMLEPLMLKLVENGHNVTVLSHYPRTQKIQNYTDVDLRGLFPPYKLEFEPWSVFDDALELFAYGSDHCQIFAASNQIQNFIKADNKFDLIFIEAFDTDCLLGLVARFKAPFILYSAMGLPVWESDWIYNPVDPAYIQDSLSRMAGNMNFLERLQNAGCHLLFRVMSWYQSARPALKIIRKYFDKNLSTLEELKRNVSFIFVNSFHGVTGVRPLFPNVIEIGGIHLKPPKPLPETFEKFMNESDGVILISMGSIVKSHTLSDSIKQDFIDVISGLKERVLWKWEEEFLNKPKNLMTASWFPQSDLLGHSKTKVFISHGGIHGLYEAICNGVPIIGLPLFGDQIGNLKALELKGVAVVIDFPQLNRKTLSSAINKVLGNDSYRKNAELLSKIFKDQPQSPLEKALFWSEYALRHKGAHHFQNGASHLNWFQYTLIDVFLFIISSVIMLIAVFYYSLKILKIV